MLPLHLQFIHSHHCSVEHLGYFQLELLQIVLQQTFLYMSFSAYKYIFLLGTHLGINLLGQRINICLVLVDATKQIVNMFISNHTTLKNASSSF